MASIEISAETHALLKGYMEARGKPASEKDAFADSLIVTGIKRRIAVAKWNDANAPAPKAKKPKAAKKAPKAKAAPKEKKAVKAKAPKAPKAPKAAKPAEAPPAPPTEAKAPPTEAKAPPA